MTDTQIVPAVPEFYRCPRCDFFHESGRKVRPSDCRPGGRQYTEQELDARGEWYEVEIEGLSLVGDEP